MYNSQYAVTEEDHLFILFIYFINQSAIDENSYGTLLCGKNVSNINQSINLYGVYNCVLSVFLPGLNHCVV